MKIFNRTKSQPVAWQEVIKISAGQSAADKKLIMADLQKIQQADPQIFADIKSRMQENKLDKIEVGFGAAGSNLNQVVYGSNHQPIINLSHEQLKTNLYKHGEQVKDFSPTQVLAHELSRVADKDYYKMNSQLEKLQVKATKYYSEFAEFCGKKGVVLQHEPKDGTKFLEEASEVYQSHPSLARQFAIMNPIDRISFGLTASKYNRLTNSDNEEAVTRSNHIMQNLEPDFVTRVDYEKVAVVRRAEVAHIPPEAKEAAAKLAVATGGKLVNFDEVPLKALPLDPKHKAATARSAGN